MSNFFVSIMEICDKFDLSEFNHCSNGQATGTFEYSIEALRDIGCHSPIMVSTIM